MTELDNFDSYNCRGRNRVFGAKMSEHGRANALDLRGIKLANGKMIALTERDTPREQREKVLELVCARFSTVLGPGSDGYHEDHIHLDLAERRSNYRICQWAVWDPMPKVAPLMPAARPDDAPPRETGEERARRLKEEAPQLQAERPATAPALPPVKPDQAREENRPEQARPKSAQQTPVLPKPELSAAPAPSVQQVRKEEPKPQRKRRLRREPSLIESIFQSELRQNSKRRRTSQRLSLNSMCQRQKELALLIAIFGLVGESPAWVEHDHNGAHLDPVVEVDHVLIGHADAARRNRLADIFRLVRAMDTEQRVAAALMQIQRARAERIVRAATTMLRQAFDALVDVRGRNPASATPACCRPWRRRRTRALPHRPSRRSGSPCRLSST